MEESPVVLTTEEAAAYDHLVTIALDLGYRKSRAYPYAWRELKKEFPRLKPFSGCVITE